MNTAEKYEVFGTIEKEETLFVLKDKIMPGTTVLEAIEPFPGYYHEIPDETMPVYIYLATRENYTWEDIMRAANTIKNKKQMGFETAKCYINLSGQTLTAIRLRHLKDYDQVAFIQEGFKACGIHMLEKPVKKEKDFCLIKLSKFFKLKKLEAGVYLDDSEPFHGYFEIPGKLEWKAFEEITRNVKYNWDYSKFDAALGTIHMESKLRNMIRIYSPKITAPYLLKCRDTYLERIN